MNYVNNSFEGIAKRLDLASTIKKLRVEDIYTFKDMANTMPLDFTNEMLVLLCVCVCEHLTATLENDSIIRALAICNSMSSKMKYRNRLIK